MERKGRRPGFLERTAEVFDLPADALAGLPKLELVGDRELWVENHRGILSYGGEEIAVNAEKAVVRIHGRGLELVSMSRPNTDRLFLVAPGETAELVVSREVKGLAVPEILGISAALRAAGKIDKLAWSAEGLMAQIRKRKNGLA